MTNWGHLESSLPDAAHIEELSLPEGVVADLPLLLAPVTSEFAVSHNNPFLHPGIKVEGDVPSAVCHEVEHDSAAHIQGSVIAICALT